MPQKNEHYKVWQFLSCYILSEHRISISDVWCDFTFHIFYFPMTICLVSFLPQCSSLTLWIPIVYHSFYSFHSLQLGSSHFSSVRRYYQAMISVSQTKSFPTRLTSAQKPVTNPRISSVLPTARL